MNSRAKVFVAMGALLLALLAPPSAVADKASTGAGPQPIDEAQYVRIGGIDQWITIKGADRNNPVVLFLHGGPGDAYSPFADSLFQGWERDLTLVQWDQRGAGRTYGRNGPSIEPTMTVERMIQDGLEVAEYLLQHLKKERIVLVGASWGSILGIHMAHARPDLFSAYVGMAQLVCWRQNVEASYARVLKLARAVGDQPAIAALSSIGPPPWNALSKWPVFHKWELAYQDKWVTAQPARLTLSPAYASPQERAQYAAADDFSFEHFVGSTLSGPLTQVDLTALGADFAIPIFIVQGQEDLVAVPERAKDYFDSIKAPQKHFDLVLGTGHEPSVAEFALVRAIILEQTRSRAPGHA